MTDNFSFQAQRIYFILMHIYRMQKSVYSVYLCRGIFASEGKKIVQALSLECAYAGTRAIRTCVCICGERQANEFIADGFIVFIMTHCSLYVFE